MSDWWGSDSAWSRGQLRWRREALCSPHVQQLLVIYRVFINNFFLIHCNPSLACRIGTHFHKRFQCTVIFLMAVINLSVRIFLYTYIFRYSSSSYTLKVLTTISIFMQGLFKKKNLNGEKTGQFVHFVQFLRVVT